MISIFNNKRFIVIMYFIICMCMIVKIAFITKQRDRIPIIL
jgi:hypothetical protein